MISTKKNSFYNSNNTDTNKTLSNTHPPHNFAFQLSFKRISLKLRSRCVAFSIRSDIMPSNLKLILKISNVKRNFQQNFAVNFNYLIACKLEAIIFDTHLNRVR